MFIDRAQSGESDFDNAFAGTYYAPLTPSDGNVTLRVLVDWSSVEVFGSVGEVVMTAQIFPSDDAIEVYLFLAGGEASGVELTTRQVESVWGGGGGNSMAA